MLSRFLTRRLPDPAAGRRLVVLTGPRRSGKTALVRDLYAEQLRYLDLNAERHRQGAVTNPDWGRTVGPAVLDGVSKAPALAARAQSAWNAGQVDFFILMGAFRPEAFAEVRSLAGAGTVHYELWPLTVAEAAPFFGGPATDFPAAAIPAAGEPLIAHLVRTPENAVDLLMGSARKRLASAVKAARAALQHLIHWGGLPSLLPHKGTDRALRLQDDAGAILDELADLVRIRDRDHFGACYRRVAASAGRVLSYSVVARESGVPLATVRRYVKFLTLAYRTMLLPAFRGPDLARVPKLLWIDSGTQRVVSGQTSGVTAAQYENAIAGQILFTLSSLGLVCKASCLRTQSGREVDLILEPDGHLLAFEIHGGSDVRTTDANPIEKSRELFGDRFRAGLVVYRGHRVVRLTDTVWAVPDWALLT